jgi:hypothetical protein
MGPADARSISEAQRQKQLDRDLDTLDQLRHGGVATATLSAITAGDPRAIRAGSHFDDWITALGGSAAGRASVKDDIMSAVRGPWAEPIEPRGRQPEPRVETVPHADGKTFTVPKE